MKTLNRVKADLNTSRRAQNLNECQIKKNQTITLGLLFYYNLIKHLPLHNISCATLNKISSRKTDISNSQSTPQGNTVLRTTLTSCSDCLQ